MLCKTTFSLRGLLDAGKAVYRSLHKGDQEQARHQLAWHLVSRDVSQLTPTQIAAATIESLAENLSGGLVAPLGYYAVGGLPAAGVYRFLNTADAMLGYRDEEREWLGKGAAGRRRQPASGAIDGASPGDGCLPLRPEWGQWLANLVERRGADR